jgi:hypothetical protein
MGPAKEVGVGAVIYQHYSDGSIPGPLCYRALQRQRNATHQSFKAVVQLSHASLQELQGIATMERTGYKVTRLVLHGLRALAMVPSERNHSVSSGAMN